MSPTARSTRNALVAVLAVALAACGGAPPAARSTTTVGPQGGVVAAPSGLTLSIPAGALKAETEIHVTEAAPRDGVARFELEPRGLVLAAPATVSVKIEDGTGPMKLVELENEVEHGLEAERHNEAEHAREGEIHHLGTLELRHQHTCATACGTGFECDDGVCKPHVEDPAGTAPVDGNCPAGQELDVSDNVCKAHGGGGAVGTPPVNGACPAGMELDVSDGTCKAHGGGGSSGGSGSGSSHP